MEEFEARNAYLLSVAVSSTTLCKFHFKLNVNFDVLNFQHSGSTAKRLTRHNFTIFFTQITYKNCKKRFYQTTEKIWKILWIWQIKTWQIIRQNAISSRKPPLLRHIDNAASPFSKTFVLSLYFQNKINLRNKEINNKQISKMVVGNNLTNFTEIEAFQMQKCFRKERILKERRSRKIFSK